MEFFSEILGEAFHDSIGMLPFLFAAFLLLKALERYSDAFINRALIRINKAGPLLGALFGCLPQCGFSVMAANLYSGGVITLGTLLSVFLSTSDEAVLILLGRPDESRVVFLLLLVKAAVGVVFGFLCDFLFRRRASSPEEIGVHGEGCACREQGGVLKIALLHTLRLFFYILAFSAVLNALIAAIGLGSLSSFLLKDNPLQPLLTGLIGFIPNCAASVVLTELYLNRALSFASVVAGLCSNCGMGLLVLFKMNKNLKENLKIVGLIYLFSCVSALFLSAAGF